MAAITQVRILVTANYFEVFHFDLIICVGATLFSCMIMIIDITNIIEKHLKQIPFLQETMWLMLSINTELPRGFS